MPNNHRTIEEIDALLAIAEKRMMVWRGGKTKNWYCIVVGNKMVDPPHHKCESDHSKKVSYNKAFEVWVKKGNE